MDAPQTETLPIEARELTSWSVLPGGHHVALGLAGNDGTKRRIVLPVDALSGLLTTLPRMLQSALDERFPDRSLRVVQHLGAWQLEQVAIDNTLILKLGTLDGFEVAFTLNDEHACALGAALLQTSREINPTMVRRPN